MTLEEALTAALAHWGGRKGAVTMEHMARRAVAAVGGAREAEGLTVPDAVKLLKTLRDAGLSPKYVLNCYGAFKRVLSLNGLGALTVAWPRAPSPPRKVRDRLPEGTPLALAGWLDARGWTDTGDLARLLFATGLRINVEALAPNALSAHVSADEEGRPYTVLRVTGKGGHEREVPVVDLEAQAILASEERMRAMRRVTYWTHLDRFKKAVRALGVTSRLATPHALRHSFGSDILDRSGGNLSMVQELLGHASPATTSGYMHHSKAGQLKALRVEVATSPPLNKEPL